MRDWYRRPDALNHSTTSRSIRSEMGTLRSGRASLAVRNHSLSKSGAASGSDLTAFSISRSFRASTLGQSLLPRRLLWVRLPICFTLTGVCSPCRNNAATSGTHGVHHRQLAIVDYSKGDDPNLAILASFVGTLQDRPLEDANSILEIDSVLGDVGHILGSVPFEGHPSIDIL